MREILDETTSSPADAPRRHGWRQAPATAPASDSTPDSEVGVEVEGDGEVSAVATAPPRNVGPLVALALLGAAALIVALSIITVTAGRSSTPDVEVAGTTELDAGPATTSVAPVDSAPVESSVPSTLATATTQPREPVELDDGELVLTTFYREIPAAGGDFSLAVRLENGSAAVIDIADLGFAFDLDGELIPATEVITEHTRVPADGSAVVTIRVLLPAVTSVPELVVSAVNGELARAVLP